MNARIDPSPLLPTLADIEAAAQVVYRDFAATPQYRWTLLSQRLGTGCWLKHENHTPVGAFKIRGGLTYFDQLAQRGALPTEVISATRGNHGQSMGWAARRHGVACTIVVPRGNSVEKNAAMRALGVTLIEHGDDFQEAREHAIQLAAQRLGTGCWLKHENHTPVGAFKIRGGLTYFDQLAQRGALPAEVISATRGNHGQSMGWAARRHGVACTIVVPRSLLKAF